MKICNVQTDSHPADRNGEKKQKKLRAIAEINPRPPKGGRGDFPNGYM